MEFQAQKYHQNDQLYLSLTLPFSVINKIAKPLIYSKDNKLGYQRELDKKHYTNLAEKILNNQVILPSSIILGVSEENLKGITNLRQDDGYVKFQIDDQLEKSMEIFSVVDGQHRLKALELAASKNSSLLNYKFNVIILVNKDVERVSEVKVFTDINSQAKKITTDLTLLAQHNYKLYYAENINERDLLDLISVSTAYHLNEIDNQEMNVWKSAIKLDIHSVNKTGIIGVSAFSNSVSKLSKEFIKYNNNEEILELKSKPSFEQIDYLAYNFSIFLIKAWEYVYKRWPYAFNNKESRYRFNNDFYIQKTTGVNALHKILTGCLEKASKEGVDPLNEFSDILSKSPVKAEDWFLNEIFSGLTSQSGFNKAVNIILGKENDSKKNHKRFNPFEVE